MVNDVNSVISRLPIGIDFSKIGSMLSGDGIMYVEAPLTDFTAPANIVIPIQVRKEIYMLQKQHLNTVYTTQHTPQLHHHGL